MSRPVIYMCHPVSKLAENEDNSAATTARLARNYRLNTRDAEMWLAYLIMTDRSKVYIAPWISEVRLATTTFRGFSNIIKTKPYVSLTYEEALRDDEEVVDRVDGVILTGKFISKGMQQELDRAKECGKPSLDITKITRPNIPGRGVEHKSNKALEALLTEWRVA